ncbi:DUF3048 domain-containing protein [Anaerolineales bacterium]
MICICLGACHQFYASEPTDITESLRPSITPAPENDAIGPYVYGATINPLTGLEVDVPESLNKAPVIVKVSNSPALVRPQFGIGYADLVFEHYTEVGITRFSAIFLSQLPEQVGPVRSARLIDYELTPMYQAILAFAGASIGIDKRIYGSETIIHNLCSQREDQEQCQLEADIIAPAGMIPPSDFVDRAYKGVNIGRPYFWRDEALEVPHNFFVNTKALQELAFSKGIRLTEPLKGLAFLESAPKGAQGPGKYAQIRYLTTLVEWHYFEEDGRYYRSTDGQTHHDAINEEQVSAANVIILFAGHYLTDIIESQWQDTIHWSTQITLWPEGKAILLRDGKRYDGRWVRPSRPDALSFLTNTGEIMYLKPGNSWVQVLPLEEQMNPDYEWVLIE